MPFYEYECTACKFYVEALQKISDEPLRKCPSCKKQTMKRLVSAPVFRLKGGGWYETDFKSDKENKRNLAGAEEASDSKAEAKDTTPAKAADSKPAESKQPAGKAPARKAGGKAKAAAKPGRAKAAAKKKAKRR